MRVNPYIGLSISGSIIALLTGCQLLAPYKYPLTPTPHQWKTTYDAPDAGKPTIPTEWKADPNLSEPIFSSPSDGDNKVNSSAQPSSSENPSNQQSENPQASCEKKSEPEPNMPRFEDVRRDLCNWWEIFNDPVLNELEEQALNSSYTLWAALERVIQARAQAAIDFAPLLPHLNFAPSFTRTGSLFQNPFNSDLFGLGTGGGTTNLPSSSSFSSLDKLGGKTNGTNAANASTSLLSNIPSDFRFVQTQYLVPLNLTYEVDLWCQLHNSFYAAVNHAQATTQAYLGVLLSLTADVANAYFQVRGLDAQQQVIQNNIRVRQEAFNLNRARYKAGLIVYLDVSRAEVELARAHSDSDDVRRARGLQENLLGTLVGIPASVFSIAYNPLVIPPPVIPRGIPSELLCRRPDIAEAERNLASAYRQVGVAYANFFPSFSLNAALGFESPIAHKLFSWRSRFWQVGWQVMQSVFDAGRNEGNYQYYQSLFRESMANYQETVLQAFRDVEDSLVNLRGYAAQAQDLAIAVRAARLTFELAQMRYNRGLTNYLDVTDAERQLLETEQSSVIVLGNRYISTVMLIRALGGGWGPCETCHENEDY